jgi:dUTPase
MILAKTEKAKFNVVDHLSETQRGEGGFGHTGK